MQNLIEKRDDVELDPCKCLELRALCDELMNSLSQAKALLALAAGGDFFLKQDGQLLKHYFLAFETILDVALLLKVDISNMLTDWTQHTRTVEEQYL